MTVRSAPENALTTLLYENALTASLPMALLQSPESPPATVLKPPLFVIPPLMEK